MVVMTIGKRTRKRPYSKLPELIVLVRVYAYIGVQILISFIPVKSNRIILYIHHRKGFACNPKYVVNKINEKYLGKYELLWVTQYPESCKNIPANVKVIRANSVEHKIKYLRTRIYLTNDCFPAWAFHGKKHVWINLWHGGINYKHIGFDYVAPMSKAKMKWFKLTNRQPDYFLSASEAFTYDTIKAFHLRKNCFIEYGLPRNDIFFKTNVSLKKQVFEQLGIDSQKKIVLYAPTFRDHMELMESLDIENVKRALTNRFGGEWELLIRRHYFENGNTFHCGGVDVSDYDDMNELLYIADVLISDYSSCMYDFSLLRRPCFVFAPDLENYKMRDRSFAYPISKWPYSIANTNLQLLENIKLFDDPGYRKKINKHLLDISSKDDGFASDKIVDLIVSHCGRKDNR